MENQILIGLGGTGGRVLAAFRRRFFEHYGAADTNDTLIEYVYVDSKDSDCREAQLTSAEQTHDSIWRVRGNSVGLDAWQVVPLKAHNFQAVLTNPSDFNRISSWLGDIDSWKAIWGGSPNGVVAGGQMRRFGRYLLAANVAEFDVAFNHAVGSVRRRGRSTQDSQEALKVHVFAGLAGGTGSGTFIDVVCRIRALTYFSEAVKILLYVVPPQLEQTTWATHTYYANGYAALLELNAFLVGAYHPADISGQTAQITCQKPVDNVFVITNRNTNDTLVDVERVIPQVIAETVFQTIVLSGEAIDKHASDKYEIVSEANWRGALEGENVALNPETDYEPMPEDPPPPLVRANRFLSFGLKRIAIPCDDIREHFNQVFVRSTLLQMHYNHWTESFGYEEGSLGFGMSKPQITRDQETDWGLSEAQLRLDSKTFTSDPDGWLPAGRAFEGWITGIAQRFREEYEQKGRGGKITKIADAVLEIETAGANRFEHAYRGDEGVLDYYRTKQREVHSRARQIQANIESYFYDRWLAGHISLRQVEEHSTEIAALVKKKLIKLQKEKEILESELSGIKTAQSASKARIEKSSSGLRALLSQSSPSRAIRELEVYAESTSGYYAKRTRMQANAFAVELAMEVQRCLERFLVVVQRIQLKLGEAVERCDSKIAAIGLFNKQNEGGYLERFFDSERTHNVEHQLRSSQSDQQRVTTALRDYLRSALDKQGQGTFTKFEETYSAPKLVSDLQKPAGEQVTISHDKIPDPHDKILDANILSRFYKEFAGQEEKLQLRMRDWTKQAAVLTKFDATERQRQDIANKSQRTLVAFVPSTNSASEELQNIRQLIIKSIKGEFSGVEIVKTFDSPQELTLISIENMFPLRVLDFVGKLKLKYESVVGGRDPKRARLEMHLEGDGLQFPPLLMPTRADQRRTSLPYWLLAESMNLLEELTSPTTGETHVRFKRELKDGRSDYVTVGNFLKNRVDTIEARQAGLLQHYVKNEARKLTHKEMRNAVKEKLLAFSVQALSDAEGDHTAQSYQVTDAAVEQAIKILG